MLPRSFRPRGVSKAFMVVAILSSTLPATAAPERALTLSTPDAAAFARARRHVSLGAVGTRAFEYFERLEERNWSAYLRRIRPTGVSPEAKARLLAVAQREGFIQPSSWRQAKLAALAPVLDYLERRDMSVKIGRMGRAWVGFLEGAAVLVSEEATDILTAEELQAVVAHELAHEYFSAEYATARREKQFDTVKEIELRCDALSIVTLRSLDLRPEAMLSAVSKIASFNERRRIRISSTLSPSLEERMSFGRAMIEVMRALNGSGRGAGW